MKPGKPVRKTVSSEGITFEGSLNKNADYSLNPRSGWQPRFGAQNKASLRALSLRRNQPSIIQPGDTIIIGETK
jgi:hypothetical protein